MVGVLDSQKNENTNRLPIAVFVKKICFLINHFTLLAFHGRFLLKRFNRLIPRLHRGEHLAQAGGTVAVKTRDVAVQVVGGVPDVVRAVAYLLAGKAAELLM